MQKKIALDVGDKTIGVAVSDPLLITAQGVTTIERIGIRKDAGKVMDLIKEYRLYTVVIGLPKNWTKPTALRRKKYIHLKPCWKIK